MFYFFTILLLNLFIIFIIVGLLFSILFPLKFNNLLNDNFFNVSIETLKIIPNPYNNSEKVTVYESGGKYFENVNTLSFFSQFYLLGILFLVFDVEILIIYPFATHIQLFSLFSYILIIFFIQSIFFGFLYELFCGSLDF